MLIKYLVKCILHLIYVDVFQHSLKTTGNIRLVFSKCHKRFFVAGRSLVVGDWLEANDQDDAPAVVVYVFSVKKYKQERTLAKHEIITQRNK